MTLVLQTLLIVSLLLLAVGTGKRALILMNIVKLSSLPAFKVLPIRLLKLQVYSFLFTLILLTEHAVQPLDEYPDGCPLLP